MAPSVDYECIDSLDISAPTCQNN